MEIAQDSNRNWDGIPASIPGNLPDALPASLKNFLFNPLMIYFEATPDGAVFHIGAVFNGLVLDEDYISFKALAIKYRRPLWRPRRP